MEIYPTKFFIVHYAPSERNQIESLVSTLQEKLTDLLCFFSLEKFEKQIDIIIYSDVAEYKNHMLKYTPEYHEWMIGDTNDGNINMLSLGNCKMTQTHKNMTVSEYEKVVVHELVHICQQKINPNAYGCNWFWEALALNLSGQRMNEAKIDCTRDQLMFGYHNLTNGYSISYTIGKYMLANYPHERLLSYVKNPQNLWNDTEKILNDFRAVY